MTDDRNEREQKSSHMYELSETPFGGSALGSESAPEPGEPVLEVEKFEPATEPQPVAEPPKPVEIEEPISMETAMAQMGGPGVDYSGTFRSLTPGDVVDGVVVHIDREGVLVDVGTKSEGTIKPTELTRDPGANPEDVVAVGEKIKVYVVESESQDGGPVLSKKRADFENAWDRVEKAHADGEVIKAMVTDRVKGGLVIDLGIRGFVPASHVQSGKLKNLDRFVGQSMPFKVIEVDRERRKVVLSNRLAAEEERTEMRKTTVSSLAEGQIREGVVRRLTDYGAFVDLGGVDGLLHISEMSWTRINHPSESVRVGQKIQVMVLKLNLDAGRVSLGLRQILPDPWEEIKRMYRTGDVVKGLVSRLVPFGAFVQVEGGVEGIIPNSELAIRRVNGPEDVVSVGQEVEVKVIDLRPDERRLTLSLKQLQSQKEREREESDHASYVQARPDSKTTIGDLIGEQLGGIDFSSSEKTEKKPRARAAKKRAIEEAEAMAEAEEMIEIPEAEISVEEVTVVEAIAVEEPVVEKPVAKAAVADKKTKAKTTAKAKPKAAAKPRVSRAKKQSESADS